LVLVIFTAVGLGSCSRPEITTTPLIETTAGAKQTLALGGDLSEVSPPEALQALKPFLAVYDPQVQILSPRDGETLTDTSVTVRVQVRDLPIYRDPDLELGPHLHLILDDQPGQDIYDADATITFADIAPGTHTLRVFAARPWHESFKNEAAYDQVTFNVFTTSSKNDAGQNAPLLTYSQPQGIYSSEPILLDFYLRNVPLHLIAAEDDSMSDWRIRCTVNGESFVFDRWQPLYLKGFKPGKNWVKLELIDETGQLFPGPFNSAIGVVEYRPGESDPLSSLIRGEIPNDVARVLVDPTYAPPAPPTSPATPLDNDDLINSEPVQQRQDDEVQDKQPDSETQQEFVEIELDSLETETIDSQEEDSASPMPQAESMSSDDEASPEPIRPSNSTAPVQSLKATDDQDAEEAAAQTETISSPDVEVEQSSIEVEVSDPDGSDLGDTLPSSPTDLNAAGNSEADTGLPGSPVPIDLPVDDAKAVQGTPAVKPFDEEIDSAPAGVQDANTSESTTKLGNSNDSETLVPDSNRPGLSTLVE
jgi:hypothetical protein